MKILNRLSIKHFVLLFLLFALSYQAKGNCECDSIPSFEEAYDNANVVFTGKVIDVTTNPIKSGLKITFLIDQSWKRPIEPYSTVNTNYEVSCGYPFRKGEQYLVYITRRRSLYAQKCSRAQPLAEAAADIALLGKGIPPGHTPGMQRVKWMMIIMTILGLLFVAFVVLRKRIWKPRA